MTEPKISTDAYERIKFRLETFDTAIIEIMNQLHPAGTGGLPTRRDEYSLLWDELGDTHYYLVTAIEFTRQIIEKRKAKP